MPAPTQLLLPFASLDFPGRDVVCVWEIAGKLNYSPNHIFAHIEAGNLQALDSKLSSRRNVRIPIEEYRRWALTLLTGPKRRELLEGLSEDQRYEIACAAIAQLSGELLADVARRAAARKG